MKQKDKSLWDQTIDLANEKYASSLEAVEEKLGNPEKTQDRALENLIRRLEK